MKLVGELKDKVEKAENQEEAKKIIKDAGMELTDEEMDQVAGGAPRPTADKAFCRSLRDGRIGPGPLPGRPGLTDRQRVFTKRNSFHADDGGPVLRPVPDVLEKHTGPAAGKCPFFGVETEAHRESVPDP